MAIAAASVGGGRLDEHMYDIVDGSTVSALRPAPVRWRHQLLRPDSHDEQPTPANREAEAVPMTARGVQSLWTDRLCWLNK